VDVTTWPRCDAECSPERGYYYHPSRHSAGAADHCRLGLPVDLPAQLRAGLLDRPGGCPPPAPVGGHRPDRRGTDPGAAGTAAGQPGRAAVGVRRRLRLRPAHPGPRPCARSGAGAAARRPLLLRRPATSGALTKGRPATPPRRQVQLRRPGYLAGPDRNPDLPGRPVRHRDRQGLERAASQAAAPPRPRHPRAPPDRARHHPARPGPAGPGPHAAAQGAVAVVVRPRPARPGPGLAGLYPPVRPGAHRPVL
jgi:hypothetical protein